MSVASCPLDPNRKTREKLVVADRLADVPYPTRQTQILSNPIATALSPEHAGGPTTICSVVVLLTAWMAEGVRMHSLTRSHELRAGSGTRTLASVDRIGNAVAGSGGFALSHKRVASSAARVPLGGPSVQPRGPCLSAPSTTTHHLIKDIVRNRDAWFHNLCTICGTRSSFSRSALKPKLGFLRIHTFPYLVLES